MEIERALQQLELLQKKLYAYHCADSSLYLDAVTTAPSDTSEGRGVAMSILAGESQKLMTSPETKALLDELSARAGELDLVHRREVEELRRSCEQLTRIPADEYMAYKELCNRADDVWHKAKAQDDFALFCPVLQELVDYNRRFAGYYDASKAPYDALLNEYERGVDRKMLDSFFATLREGLVPLIHKIGEKPQIDDSFLHQEYPAAQQKAFADYLMEVMGLDRSIVVWARRSTPSRWNSTIRMSASPPTTTSTMWHPRCTLSSTRAAMRCMNWASGMTCSTPVLRAASRWASTRASPVSMRTSLAGRGPSWKQSIPRCRSSFPGSWAA